MSFWLNNVFFIAFSLEFISLNPSFSPPSVFLTAENDIFQ
ncbi:hypothetical protein YPPY66_0740 [Yersinia pestis PY-66]|uniref:Uncharacterized protein n=1 Tax=Yersinia pestis PY-08 TaxID=992134 RepID=A0AB72ZPD6_YERPE|nr:hypothetical protein YPPY02_0594 [Yersinia pestis PY-02]EIR11081.1 hypothetical protein YPPY06_0659 [Yersinia pestis PY-06]EIR24129.1 hypothetical protein YPPY08_0674 [Yersinia pestis PY-08]EIR26029.1 hypothetical protein YPPY09_0642 [Yersinia pestis PY-09]EIR52095.1 hypothetical protein YPPY15_0620 [Yersinia pestis PY-15]EIR68800.1 hypothetical protein YPPY25_0699 [Yersinia pestis PY-25]EIR83486.1 hypothetical protein YPPY32_0880 [Yersinia pestis PY-32]EIS10617.1 hypothetical protein YPP